MGSMFKHIWICADKLSVTKSSTPSSIRRNISGMETYFGTQTKLWIDFIFAKIC